MTDPLQDPDPIVDCRGYRCPMPVIKLEASLRRLSEGQKLTIMADDPLAAVDIPHYCQEGGHRAERLENRGERQEICVFRVTHGGQ